MTFDFVLPDLSKGSYSPNFMHKVSGNSREGFIFIIIEIAVACLSFSYTAYIKPVTVI